MLACACSGGSGAPGEEDAAGSADPTIHETGQDDAGAGTEPATHTDTDSAAPPPDTAPPPPWPVPVRPTSWGPGFVDISGPILGDQAFDIVPGQPDPFLSPQQGEGLFADLDGDGTPEVIASTSHLYGHPNHHRVFRYAAGALTFDPALTDSIPPLDGALVDALHLDLDDHVDLMVGSHLWGLGWGPDYLPFASVAPDPDVPYYAGDFGLTDLDGDGWLDLVIGDKSCHSTIMPMLRTGPDTYTRRPDLLVESTPHGETIGVLPLHLADGHRSLVSATTACSVTEPHPGFYDLAQAPADDVPTLTAVDLAPDDAYWRFDPQTAGAPYTRVMPMGAATADLDGDGFLDLLLSLGHARLAVLQGHGDGTFTDVSHLAAIDFPMSPFGGPDIPWSFATPDLDQDGLPELVITLGDDATSFHWHQGHDVTPLVYWNAGAFAFEDITAEVGLDALQGNWKGLAVEDLDEDGDADLVVGGMAMLPRVLRNAIDTPFDGLSLTLHSHLSPAGGRGARVEVLAPDLPPRVWQVGHLANMGANSPPRVFAGLRDAPATELVRVHWPSGHTSEHPDLAAGQAHHLYEPPLVTIQPQGRHRPADGEAVFTLTLQPHTAAGDPDPSVDVEVQVHGAGTLTDLTQDGAVWTATITAPDTPGSARLEVRFDGTPLAIQPKVWWDPITP